jgi:hypothetical protein
MHVNPGDLHVPPERIDGADPFKLADQINEFGESFEEMPPLDVTEGPNGEYMINNGVTRATRAYMVNPGGTVPINVIGSTSWDLSELPTIRDTVGY